MKKSEELFCWKLESLFEKHHILLPTQSLPKTDKKVLQQGIYHSGDTGNNTFSPPGKSIYMSPILQGNINDIAEGNETVLYDQGRAETGLKQCVFGKTSYSNTDIFVCDNHNRVLWVFEKYKKIQPLLIHIDQHKDEALFHPDCNEKNYETHSRVCDYIPLAKKFAWIQSSHISLTNSEELQKFQTKTLPDTPIILNIDIDIFAKECCHLSTEEIVISIIKTAKKASVICLATSPLFIPQNLAQNITKILWKYL
ncbi:hypothetical protein COB57_04005 [Candidatus Peregrinibacteria bacterium]|nr:MAG: hypothetical protein COB57_04005 [Candidatus Peregrinibacteria bacterium]